MHCKSGQANYQVTDLEAIVEHYKRNNRSRIRATREHYSSLASIDEAIENAGMAWRPDGKRHGHQTRIKRAALEEATRRLLESKELLRQCKDFEELYRLVDETIRPISGIGELTVYDTADRLGMHLRRAPERVYLHAGTKDGARRLGLDDGPTIAMEELPEPLRELEPYEVEDCLCIYKDHFRRATQLDGAAGCEPEPPPAAKAC